MSDHSLLCRPPEAGLCAGSLFSYAAWHEGDWRPCADRWLVVDATVPLARDACLRVDAINQHGRLANLQLYRSDKVVVYVK